MSCIVPSGVSIRRVILAAVVAIELAVSTSPQVPIASELQELSTKKLVALADGIQTALRESLLQPSPEVLRDHVEQLKMPETGIMRLLFRGSAFADAVGLTGGGSYYSFANEDKSAVNSPDIVLQAAHPEIGDPGAESYRLRSAGRTAGSLPVSHYVISRARNELYLSLPLGDVALARVPDDGEIPDWLPGERREAWSTCWKELVREDASPDSTFRRRCDQLELTRDVVGAAVPATYLLRAYDPDRHDTLVAVRVVAMDADTVTMLWKRLIDESSGHGRLKYESGPRAFPVPKRFDGLEADELLAVLDAIRTEGESRLLAVDERTRRKYAKWLPDSAWEDGSGGFCRLLHPDGEAKSIVRGHNSGATVAFGVQKEAHLGAADLRLAKGMKVRYELAAKSGCALLVDLGSVSTKTLKGLFLNAELHSKRGELHELWKGFSELDMSERQGAGCLTDDQKKWVSRVGAARSIPAKEGHAYLLKARSVTQSSGEAYVLGYLCSDDEYGYTLLWRSLL